jgi:riboflavin biosynthesis pyrimidine reductase
MLSARPASTGRRLGRGPRTGVRWREPGAIGANHARDGERRLRAHAGLRARSGESPAAAGDGDVAIQGGATTINQYLAAGLIDELRLHIVPLTLGAGTRLFEGVPPLKLEQLKLRAARQVTHVTYRVLS